MRKYYRNSSKPSKSVIFKPDSERKYYRKSPKPSKSVIFKPDSKSREKRLQEGRQEGPQERAERLHK